MIQKGYQNAIQEYFFQVASALQLLPKSDSVNFGNFYQFILPNRKIFGPCNQDKELYVSKTPFSTFAKILSTEGNMMEVLVAIGQSSLEENPCDHEVNICLYIKMELFGLLMFFYIPSKVFYDFFIAYISLKSFLVVFVTIIL